MSSTTNYNIQVDSPETRSRASTRQERVARYSTSKELYKIQERYTFQDYAPRVFDGIRRFSGISREQYLESLQPQVFLGNLTNQKFSEGRSGSFFCFSPDKSLIIKTIPKGEANVLKNILPTYYQVIIFTRSWLTN